MIRRVLLLFVLLLAFAGVMPGEAHAVTFRAGEKVDIPPGMVIPDDLYVAGGEIHVGGRIEGDLVVAGGKVTLTGEVRDDVIAAGGELSLDGSVGQSVRAAGGRLTLGARVGRDALMAGQRIEQLAGSQVAGETVVTGQDLVLRGRTEGALQANGRDVLLDGRFGSAEIRAQDLTLTAGARVDGPLRYVSPRAADLRPGAVVAGPLSHQVGTARRWAWSLPAWLGRAFLFLAGSLAGVILALLMPGGLAAVAREFRRSPGLSMGAGAGILFGVPILAILLMITLIGIPLAFTVLGLYALGLYLAWVFAAIVLGDSLLLRLPVRSLRLRMSLAALLGVAVLLLLQALPWIGGIVALLALMAGFGGVTLALAQRFR